MTPPTLEEKLTAVQTILRDLESVVVAYSGGVDSTLLLHLAHETLGDRAVGVTALAAGTTARERAAAEALARRMGARFATVATHEIDDPRYRANAPDRCYVCKGIIMRVLLDYAQREGCRAVVDGANADDAGDYRPGQRAARELGVRSPLQEAGIMKVEVRALARARDLPNWDQPAAACVASRIPYGTPITPELLAQVAAGEDALRALGFGQLRVRHHGDVARIELSPAEFPAALAQREAVVRAVRAAGYAYVALDLEGFRSGSMNEVIETDG